jgi:2-phosphoglycerate kinase
MTTERIKLAERIKAVEVKQELTYQELLNIKSEIKDFVKSADYKYATKEELHSAISLQNQRNKMQDEQIKGVKKFMDKYGPIIIVLASQAGMGYLLIKGGQP